MANPLTGDFDAVFQVSVRQINGLLATLHQNGASAGAVASFPHRLSIAVGDAAAGASPGAQPFGKWLATAGVKYTLAGGGNPALEADFDRAPPGAAPKLVTEFVRWKDAVLKEPQRDAVVGVARVQCSSPVISLKTGEVNSLSCSVFARAQYLPDPGTQSLGQPIHGEVRIDYTPRVVTSPLGERGLSVPFPANDSNIRFLPEPGTGLSSGQTNEIQTQIRKVLRSRFKPMLVPLQGDFPFADFKGVGSMPVVPSQALAIALPASLANAAPPAGDLGSVSNAFIGNSDFAIAISREALTKLIQPLLESFKTKVEQLRPRFLLATYKPRFSSGPALTFQNGRVVLSGRVEIETRAFLRPNGFVSFEQALTIKLDAGSQNATLEAVGDPTVDESWFIPHGIALDLVRSNRDAALAKVSKPVSDLLGKTRASLNQALAQFDPSASARYTTSTITPDGVIVAGEIATQYHYAPIRQFAETADGTGFTAFSSWIPGGRILNYHWSWVESRVFTTEGGQEWTIPWFAKVRSVDEPHWFLLPKPDKVTSPSQICLLIEGTQVSANGIPQPISEGKSCRVSAREPILTVPAGFDKVFIPRWQVDPAPDAILGDSILGYIDVVAATGRPPRQSSNTLVHFCDWRSNDRPLAGLQRGLELSGRSQLALQVDVQRSRTRLPTLTVVIVLPPGGLRITRREFERRLGELAADEVHEANRPVRFEFTEDTRGGWGRTFGVDSLPATFLLNARGEYVWRHSGEVEPERLARALDQHLLPTEGPAESLVELTLRPGQRLPQIALASDGGAPWVLRQSKGRRLILCFWQSWLTPCQIELRRLQQLHAGDSPDRPQIVAFCGDDDVAEMEHHRRNEQLTVPLVHDPQQQIARLLGVRLWPTTISVNADGFVEDVQFGIATGGGREVRGADRT